MLTTANTYSKFGKLLISVCAWCEPNRRPKPGESLTHGICAVHLFAQVFAIGLDQEAAQRNRPEELRSKFRPKIF